MHVRCNNRMCRKIHHSRRETCYVGIPWHVHRGIACARHGYASVQLWYGWRLLLVLRFKAFHWATATRTNVSAIGVGGDSYTYAT